MSFGKGAPGHKGRGDGRVEHSGLGTGADGVAQVNVTWPTTGEATVPGDLPANTAIVVREGQPGYEVE